ncbi:hypothetical protein ACFE04_006251 [Oxalis oulophora]
MIYQIIYNVEVSKKIIGGGYCLSISVDGKIKTWLYASKGSLIDYDAHGHACSRMILSADVQRLFSCGTNIEGESQIDEWNENEGTMKRTYQGVANHCSSRKNQINDLPVPSIYRRCKDISAPSPKQTHHSRVSRSPPSSLTTSTNTNSSQSSTTTAVLISDDNKHTSLIPLSAVWSIGDEGLRCTQIHDMKDHIHNLVVSNSIAYYVPQVMKSVGGLCLFIYMFMIEDMEWSKDLGKEFQTAESARKVKVLKEQQQ